jgi:penicillin-insensitive murein endopeptidase
VKASPVIVLLSSLLLGVCAVPVVRAQTAQTKENRWALATAPAPGGPSSIGEYTSGCLRGAARLPLDGPGYQVMHPSRLRYYGHPVLVEFIEQLGKTLHSEQVGDVLVGDLSQPRGGPAPGGHSSHQTGLDVDLWFWQPPAAARGPLSWEEREATKSRSVLDGKAGTIQAAESARVLALLRATALDPHVERIFVHPIIKRDACLANQANQANQAKQANQTNQDRSWLRKLRPWFGHDDHFHVRLACPGNASDCVVQSPVPQGDGCNELDWWFSPAALEDRKKGQATYQAKVGKAPGMPVQCLGLLDKPLPKTAARSNASTAASVTTVTAAAASTP